MTTLLVIAALITAALIYIGFAYRAPDMSQFDHPETPLVIGEHEVSDAHHDVVAKLGRYTAGDRTRDIKSGRQKFEDMFAVEVDAEIRPVDVHGIPAEWVLAKGADPAIRLLYIHGGAFMVGSPKSHRFLSSELSKRTGASVLSIDYRMMPEFKIIHSHEDARTAYEWILLNGPDGSSEAKSLFVAGDSAGGNLTLAVIAWAKNNGLRAADGAIAFAPLTDASLSSPTWKDNLQTDPFLGPSLGPALKIPGIVRAIFGKIHAGRHNHHPETSPLFGHLGGLPPTLIQVSKHEMLYGDAQRYHNKALAEGGDVTLQVWPRLVHVFQGFSELPEAHDALDRAAEFVKSKI
jgi:acetyl esterase/lipase